VAYINPENPELPVHAFPWQFKLSHHNFATYVHDMETHMQALLMQACNWGWRDVRRIMHSGNHNRGFSL
jgi:hypothetical protein